MADKVTLVANRFVPDEFVEHGVVAVDSLDFELLGMFILDANADTSLSHLEYCLKFYTKNEFIRDVLKIVYDPHIQTNLSKLSILRHYSDVDLRHHADGLHLDTFMDYLRLLVNGQLWNRNVAMGALQKVMSTRVDYWWIVFRILSKNLEIKMLTTITLRRILGDDFISPMKKRVFDKLDIYGFDYSAGVIVSPIVDGLKVYCVVDADGPRYFGYDEKEYYTTYKSNIVMWRMGSKRFVAEGILTSYDNKGNAMGDYVRWICRARHKHIENPVFAIHDYHDLEYYNAGVSGVDYADRYKNISAFMSRDKSPLIKDLNDHFMTPPPAICTSSQQLATMFREAISNGYSGVYVYPSKGYDVVSGNSRSYEVNVKDFNRIVADIISIDIVDGIVCTKKKMNVSDKLVSHLDGENSFVYSDKNVQTFVVKFLFDDVIHTVDVGMSYNESKSVVSGKREYTKVKIYYTGVNKDKTLKNIIFDGFVK